MRKRLKNKKRSCPVCKPHKRGISNRWKDREEQQLREDEKRIEKVKKEES